MAVASWSMRVIRSGALNLSSAPRSSSASQSEGGPRRRPRWSRWSRPAPRWIRRRLHGPPGPAARPARPGPRPARGAPLPRRPAPRSCSRAASPGPAAAAALAENAARQPPWSAGTATRRAWHSPNSPGRPPAATTPGCRGPGRPRACTSSYSASRASSETRRWRGQLPGRSRARRRPPRQRLHQRPAGEVRRRQVAHLPRRDERVERGQVLIEPRLPVHSRGTRDMSMVPGAEPAQAGLAAGDDARRPGQARVARLRRTHRST